MAKPKYIVLPLMTVLLLCGCGSIGIYMKSEVRGDAAIMRRIRFTVPKEYPASDWLHFELPKVPQWLEVEPSLLEKTRERLPVVDPDTRTRGFVMADYVSDVFEDYVRYDYSEKPSAASNSVYVGKEGDYIVYRETFRDTAQPLRVREAWNDLAEAATDYYLRKVRSLPALQEYVSSWNFERARGRILDDFREDMDMWWGSMLAKDDVTLIREEDIFEGFLEIEEYIEARFYEFWREELRPRIASEKYLARAAFEVETSFFSDESEDTRQAIETFQETLRNYGGAHLPVFFLGEEVAPTDFTFTLEVDMPGEIIESNATEIEGNRAAWHFNFMSFLLKDLKLYAKSEQR